MSEGTSDVHLAAAAAGGRPSVLVVEDDPHIRRLIETVLTDAGYRCSEAADTRAADALLQEETFQVLVCDINLPGESGVEFVRRIRAGHADVAVLMVTAVDAPTVAASALESGADGYLTKPFRPNDIVIGVLNVIRQRAVVRDHRAERAQLEEASLHDPVTGLPERRLALRLLADTLEAAQDSGTDVSALVVNLDRFSLIKAALEPEAGNRVLLEVVARLRAATGRDDTIARLDADEFLLTHLEAADAEPGSDVGDRVVAALARPVSIDDRALSVSASVGIAVAHAGAGRAQTLLRHAEIAMRRAKATGGNSVCHFQMAMRERWTQRLTAEMELRRAIDNEQFHLCYQPIVDLQAGVLTGFEALLRWEHPDGDTVVPGRFVPMAEETGMVVDLGAWVIAEACRQIREWTDALGSTSVPRVSVNVSPRQFAEPSFMDGVAATLRGTGIEHGRLAFEITERQLLEGSAPSPALESARALGIPLILDDFGTGYSSLGYLKRFPVQALKIDRSFVSELPDDTSNLALVHAILALAGSLGIQVVAEGLETPEQIGLLRSLECDLGQGYLLGRPLSAAAATTLIREGGHWPELLAADRPDASEPSSAAGHDDPAPADLAPAGYRPPPRPGGEPARLLRPADAAAALGVSLKTLRRWADTGQVPMVKTPGGHRRFDAEEIRRLKLEGRADQPAVQPLLPPAGALPGVADLLRRCGDEILTAASQHLYAGPVSGWFAADDARPLVARWIDELVRACHDGDYELALSASRTLMERAYVYGTTLLERHRFIESFRDEAVRMFAEHDATREELTDAQRLFAALDQSLLGS